MIRIRPHLRLGIALLTMSVSENLYAQVASPHTCGPSKSPSVPSPLCEALAHGAAAFKEAKFEPAAAFFRQALTADPTSTEAMFYLGSAYAAQVIPNLSTPENMTMAKNATEALRQIPPSAPEYLPAVRGLAAVARNTAHLEEARTLELEVLRLAPTDAEAHYTIAVMDWMQAYKIAITLLARNELTDAGDGNPKLDPAQCRLLTEQNASIVQDGLDHVSQAVALKPNYDDAMQYANLLERRKADFACGDEAARTEALARADAWSRKAMDARKQNETSAAPTQ